VEDVDKEIWKDFVARWREVGIADWVHTDVTVDLSVGGSAKSISQDVTILSENENIVVADAAFRKLAIVAHEHAKLLCDFGLATLQDGKLSINYFGPPLD